MVLSVLKENSNGIIEKINSEKELYMRLASMGLVEGSEFNLIANHGKFPLILECDGKRFAIDRKMADSIIIKKILGNNE
jgi:Fe2+ transport system protein FeoA